MLKLSHETARAFSIAVRAASARQDVRIATGVLYESLQDAIDLRRPLCITSGRCCRFEEFGHRLFVTTMELAAFVGQMTTSLDFPQWDGSGCPFQIEKLCTVHTIRPFGCRVFFCDETSTDWQSQQYERFHSHLKRLHGELDIPYFYVEWREALAALQMS